MVETVLSGMEDRIKTDLRLPQVLVDHVEQVCYALGIPKNAFFAMGAALLCLKLLPLLPGSKRPKLVQEIEKFVTEVVEAVKQSV